MRRAIEIAAFVALGLSACGFVYDEHIVGPYREVAVDVDEQMSICEETHDSDVVHCVVADGVFAIGNDAGFIIAKQHPLNKSQGFVVDKSVTNFWIVRVADRSVFGPFNADAFKMERSRLGVPEGLLFTRVHRNLE
jgi:hypothetical protein